MPRSTRGDAADAMVFRPPRRRLFAGVAQAQQRQTTTRGLTADGDAGWLKSDPSAHRCRRGALLPAARRRLHQQPRSAPRSVSMDPSSSSAGGWPTSWRSMIIRHHRRVPRSRSPCTTRTPAPRMPGAGLLRDGRLTPDGLPPGMRVYDLATMKAQATWPAAARCTICWSSGPTGWSWCCWTTAMPSRRAASTLARPASPGCWRPAPTAGS